MTTVTLTLPFDEVVEATRTALAGQGFGVLTEIDVRATMKAKLDVEMGPYLILGACNPPLAHRALTADPALGLLLPCNVVVRETPDGVRVEAVDPQLMVQFSEAPELQAVADEAAQRLSSAIDSLVH